MHAACAALKRWPVLRRVGAVDAIAVQLTRMHVRADSRATPCRCARAARCVSDSTSASGESNRHSSTRVACSEKIAKLTPTPSHVAPSGYGDARPDSKAALGHKSRRWYHVNGCDRNAAMSSPLPATSAFLRKWPRVCSSSPDTNRRKRSNNGQREGYLGAEWPD